MSAASKPTAHWVSPLPPAETDIAHYTARILPELADRCDLTLWTDAASWSRDLEAYCEVRRLDPDHIRPSEFARAGRTLDGPDAVFIHIGNSRVFHSGLIRLARRIPSIIVLHDLAIQEMLFESIINNQLSKEVYVSEMARWYGPRGQLLATGVLNGEIRPSELAEEMPGFEIALDRAAAVMVHTPAAYDAVAKKGGLPVYLLDLPFRPSLVAPPAQRALDGPLRLMQFGYIGANRRLMQVLEALAPLRDEIPFKFDIMGNVWDPPLLMRRIAELGLTERVKIHGFVAEEKLDAQLAAAHLVFNLRHPTMGEASGSQLRIWNASAAAVVTDSGWYGSLPDEAVFKVPLDREEFALQDLMRRIAADRNLCARIGSAGRARFEARHSPERYADGVAWVASRTAPDAAAAMKARIARGVLGRSRAARDLVVEILVKRC